MENNPIHHEKYSQLANNYVALNNCFDKYFQKKPLEANIYMNCYKLNNKCNKSNFERSKTIKTTFGNDCYLTTNSVRLGNLIINKKQTINFPPKQYSMIISLEKGRYYSYTCVE